MKGDRERISNIPGLRSDRLRVAQSGSIECNREQTEEGLRADQDRIVGASREDRGVKGGSREGRIEGQLSSCAADMESKKEVNCGKGYICIYGPKRMTLILYQRTDR